MKCFVANLGKEKSPPFLKLNSIGKEKIKKKIILKKMFCSWKNKTQEHSSKWMDFRSHQIAPPVIELTLSPEVGGSCPSVAEGAF